LRALGKTPNDPMLRTMTPIQWKLCYYNVLGDEREANKKISDLVDFALRIFVGQPGGEGENPNPSQEASVGQEPSTRRPDIHYTITGGHGEAIGVRKVMSTEFDKIIESGGQYKGFETEEKK